MPKHNSNWTLITGASSGIGKALAYEFARHGHPLILVARNQQALDQIAGDLSEKFDIKTKVIAKDLSKPQACQEICQEANGNFIEVLINNAGFGFHGTFNEMPLQNALDMMEVQLGACTKLTSQLLPAMKDHQKGKILNVGSVYAFHAVPQQAVYSACKAFMLSFSESLQSELQGTGISISFLGPGITQTEFRKRMGKSDSGKAKGQTPEYVARLAYEGLMNQKKMIVPGMINRLYTTLAQLSPRCFMTWFIGGINRARGIQ